MNSLSKLPFRSCRRGGCLSSVPYMFWTTTIAVGEGGRRSAFLQSYKKKGEIINKPLLERQEAKQPEILGSRSGLYSLHSRLL